MKYAYYFLKTKAKTNLYSYKFYMSRATEKNMSELVGQNQSLVEPVLKILFIAAWIHLKIKGQKIDVTL